VVRRNVVAGTLSVFGAQVRDDNARYVAASGHNGGTSSTCATQDGRPAGIGTSRAWRRGAASEERTIRAWGGGALFGYTWAPRRWSPRLGLQFDAASGNRDPNGGTPERPPKLDAQRSGRHLAHEIDEWHAHEVADVPRIDGDDVLPEAGRFSAAGSRLDRLTPLACGRSSGQHTAAVLVDAIALADIRRFPT
jgi:hypothetical protein